MPVAPLGRDSGPGRVLVEGYAERRQFRFSFSFIARATLLVVFVYALLSAAWLARDILFIGFLGILFAAFLSIFIEWLEPYMPRWTATVLVFFTFLLVVGLFFWISWPALQTQIGTLRREVPGVVDNVADWVEAQMAAIAGERRAGDPLRQQLNERLSTEAVNVVAGALPLLNTLLGAITGSVLVLFTGIFLAMNPRMYLEGFLTLVPRRSRDELRTALEDAGGKLRRWIGAMTLLMIFIFALTTPALWLLGVPAFLALGILAGLLNFVPFVGPILSAIPAMALALTVSPLTALWVALLYVAIQQVESNALVPVLMNKAVDLPPALMLLFQMIMAVLFGFIGLVVAVPMLAVAKVLVQRIYVERLERE